MLGLIEIEDIQEEVEKREFIEWKLENFKDINIEKINIKARTLNKKSSEIIKELTDIEKINDLLDLNIKEFIEINTRIKKLIFPLQAELSKSTFLFLIKLTLTLSRILNYLLSRLELMKS